MSKETLKNFKKKQKIKYLPFKSRWKALSCSSQGRYPMVNEYIKGCSVWFMIREKKNSSGNKISVYPPSVEHGQIANAG